MYYTVDGLRVSVVTDVIAGFFLFPHLRRNFLILFERERSTFWRLFFSIAESSPLAAIDSRRRSAIIQNHIVEYSLSVG